MSQSLAQNLIHLIFSTKNRQPFLIPDIRSEMNSYLAGILGNLNSPAILVNCVADHVHALFALSKNFALAKAIEQLKKDSSKWIKSKGAQFKNFYWQGRYGAFSVSQSLVPRVRTYIAKQEEHHRKMSFQDELREFFKRHRVEFDERYMWD